jgi:hypothetical protein
MQNPEWSAWLTTVIVLTGTASPAQEALRSSMAGQAAVEARRIQPESLPYTFKTGELRLLVTPSLGVDWNDNIYTSETDPESDFILRPMVQVNLSYPVTQNNLLTLNVGVGYDQYFEHDELSDWRVLSGSELSFDIYVKDLWINLHDRFQYVQDPAQEAAVANTATYSTFDNTAGLSVTWDLDDVTLSSGYDHVNVFSTDDQYQSQDRATEMFFGRGGVKLHPRVMAGLEGTAAFTSYDHSILNDNAGYSLGAYADWQPGPYFRVQPRGGFATYQFEETSQSPKTSDQNSWYAGLTVAHQPTEVLSYSLSAGHELRLGIESNLIEDTYVRWNGQWSIINNVAVTTSLSYEHGRQGDGSINGNFKETYDWFAGGLGFSYALTKQATLALNYRLTLRSSDLANDGYTQNLVQLQFSYSLQ